MSVDLGSAHGSIVIDYSGAAAQQAIRDLNALGGAAAPLNRSMGQVGASLGVIGGGLAAGLGLAARSAIGFEGSMGNVNSILKLSRDGIAALGDRVQDLSGDVAKGPTELANALYDISSSGFTGAEGLAVLESAANAANAGLTSTQTAARGITSVLNAYGMDASEAGRVSDVLFQTVNDGVVTFDQLAANMGNTLAPAATLGVSIEELGAAYAQMTLNGIGASQAETQIASLFKAALNPTADLSDAVQGYGYASVDALVAAEGMPGLLKAIGKAAGGSTSRLYDMLGTQEAVNAAMILGRGDAEGYIDQLARMEGASGGAGATQEALAKQ